MTHRITLRTCFFPRATCQRHRLWQLALGVARNASASGRFIRRLPRKCPRVDPQACCAFSYQGSPREEWEAASVKAGLRGRRFAEKQHTRRLVGLGPLLLVGGQLRSKWWKMREIRQSRDLAGLRGSRLERREVTPSPVCVRNAVSHVTLGRVPRAPIGMDNAPNRFPPAGRVMSATCRP